MLNSVLRKAIVRLKYLNLKRSQIIRLFELKLIRVDKKIAEQQSIVDKLKELDDEQKQIV